ncbi:hypothetical protein Neosp_010609 [[Neocosmospora] mangrovei]
MNEPTESTVQAEDQPVTENGGAGVVTHNDLQALESRVESLEEMLRSHLKQIRYNFTGSYFRWQALPIDIHRNILEVLKNRGQVSRRSPPPPGSSRTSSVGSRGSSTSTDLSASIDDEAEALTE